MGRVEITIVFVVADAAVGVDGVESGARQVRSTFVEWLEVVKC